MQTIYELRNMPVKDSIIYVNGNSEDLRCLEFYDKWLDLVVCVNKDRKGSVSIKSREKLTYVEHIIPKRFLWIFKYGIKERRQEIFSDNPHSKIVDAEFITIRE